MNKIFTNKIFIVCILILVALIIFQVCQFESYNDFVIENFTDNTCTRENVTVGSSRSNPKIIDLPAGNWQSFDTTPKNPQNPNWKDRFEVKIIPGNKLQVTRLDSNSGWGQNLVLEGLKCQDGCELKEIYVGNTRSNPKTITLSDDNWVHVNPIPINEQNPSWRDTFKVELLDNNQLKITRTDTNSGWGQNLKLHGIICNQPKRGQRSTDVQHYVNTTETDDEGCSVRDIRVGSSRSKEKTITLPHGNWLSVEETPVNETYGRWSARFSIELINTHGINNKLKVTRTDSDQGWNQNLKFRGRVCPLDDSVLCIENNIRIGSSPNDNVKRIALPDGNWTSVSSVPINKQQRTWTTRFKAELMPNNILEVSRISGGREGDGWDQDLILKGLVCPNMSPDENCSIQEIIVGPSPTSGTKIIELPNTHRWSYISSTPLNDVETVAFHTELLDNNRLKVVKINGTNLQRWDINLKLTGIGCVIERGLTPTQRDKMELIGSINDKITVINDKMNRFDNVKPVKSTAYRNLFETDIPEHLDKERGSTKLSRHVFDVSQQTQDSIMDRMTNEVDKLTKFFNKELSLSDSKKIQSITSHTDGKNINLINRGKFHSIPINNGCLFVINDETGEVDYDITNVSRQDKNKICLSNNRDQHFKLNKIENLEAYQKLVGSPVIDRPIDYETIEYPFYTVQPRRKKFNNMCLQSERDSVTLQPCNFNEKQRWGGNQFTKPCDC